MKKETFFDFHSRLIDPIVMQACQLFSSISSTPYLLQDTKRALLITIDPFTSQKFFHDIIEPVSLDALSIQSMPTIQRWMKQTDLYNQFRDRWNLILQPITENIIKCVIKSKNDLESLEINSSPLELIAIEISKLLILVDSNTQLLIFNILTDSNSIDDSQNSPFNTGCDI